MLKIRLVMAQEVRQHRGCVSMCYTHITVNSFLIIYFEKLIFVLDIVSQEGGKNYTDFFIS